MFHSKAQKVAQSSHSNAEQRIRIRVCFSCKEGQAVREHEPDAGQNPTDPNRAHPASGTVDGTEERLVVYRAVRIRR